MITNLVKMLFALAIHIAVPQHGVYLAADTTLKRMRKRKVIILLVTAQQRYFVVNPRLDPLLLMNLKVVISTSKYFFSETSAKLAAKTSKKYVKASKSTKGLKSTIAIKAKTSKGKGKGNFTKNTSNLAMNVTD